jgi:S-adenosylmethionine decarboxylase proenzyme
MDEHDPRGHHVLIDAWDVEPDLLRDSPAVLALMEQASLEAGATVLQAATHEFAGAGATLILLLAESHLSIHTYPEHGGYFADFFTCGDLNPLPAALRLADALGGDFRLSSQVRTCGALAEAGDTDGDSP